MTLFEKVKTMTLEEMAIERVRRVSFVFYDEHGKNIEIYNTTSDGRQYSYDAPGKVSAIKHEVELLNERYIGE